MILRFALLACLLLSACGSGNQESANNHGFGFHFDVQGASGLKLRVTATLAADDPRTNVGTYEKVFLEVEQCAGITAPPPFVIIVPQGSLGSAPDTRREGNPVMPLAGLYFEDPPLVVIDETTAGYRHELVHYLLDFSTGNADGGHTSPLFAPCAGG